MGMGSGKGLQEGLDRDGRTLLEWILKKYGELDCFGN
jgi:hypothetical protein